MAITGTMIRRFMPSVRLWSLVLLAGVAFAGCSRVNILQPADGAVLSAGQPVLFEGQVTRTLETAGEDRSNELAWDSSRDGHLADGKQFTTSTLSTGSHTITASWPGKDRRKSIGISIVP